MIKKEKEGYVVYSKDGKKRLSRPYKSKAKAIMRLLQIEYFKRKKEK